MAGALTAWGLVLILAVEAAALNPAPLYNTTAKRVHDKLNVHLVPHTHDDGGWLKTFDQYYYGARQDIQEAGVQYILDSVVQSLRENPDRRFSYGEMGFFSKWWSRQPPSTQAQVRGLVASGQLDFINGGWVQHDEAAAHYNAMIDQTTRGHRFLNATFGKIPNVAWQIDPFGHSSTQASLLTAALGFKGLFFGRADYQDMSYRAARKELEFMWRGSQSWGSAADVFTHIYPTGNYGAPPGFDWNYGTSWDPPIIDDPDSPDYNVPERVEAFISMCRDWSSKMAGNDILFMMGSDFTYANANAYFQNMDKLIHYVNKDGRVNVFYSTPGEYVDAKVGSQGVKWALKTDDFFPYADCPHCYWTGYFTSRPSSKGYIRSATALLAAARQLQVLAGGRHDANTYVPTTAAAGVSQQRLQQEQPAPAAGGGGRKGGGGAAISTAAAAGDTRHSPPSLDALEAAVSLTQHHDAITGTAKQAVANDYHRLLAAGIQEAYEVMAAALHTLMTSPPASHTTYGDATSSSSSSGSSTSVTKGRFKQEGFARKLMRAAYQHLLNPLGAWWVQDDVGSSRTASKPCGTIRARSGTGSTYATMPTAGTTSHDASSSGSSANPAEDTTAAAGGSGTTAPPSGLAMRPGFGQLSFCPLLNSSVCSASVSVLGPCPPGAADDAASSTAGCGCRGEGLLLVVYNPLAWPREELVRVPVGGGEAGFSVADASSGLPLSPAPQVTPITAPTALLQDTLVSAGLLPDRKDLGSRELGFMVQLPPLGFVALTITPQPQPTSETGAESTEADGLPNAKTATRSTTRSGTTGGSISATSSSTDGGGSSSTDSGGSSSGSSGSISATSSSTDSGSISATGSTGTGSSSISSRSRADVPGHVSNAVITLHLDPASGRFTAVSAADGSWALAFSQDILVYNSSTGEEDWEGEQLVEGSNSGQDLEGEVQVGHDLLRSGALRGKNKQQQQQEWGVVRRRLSDSGNEGDEQLPREEQQAEKKGAGGLSKSKSKTERPGQQHGSKQQEGGQQQQEQQCGVGHGVRRCHWVGNEERGESNGGQSSGAYIFRPSGFTPAALPLVPSDSPLHVEVLPGPLYPTIIQSWSPWAHLVTRLNPGADHLDQEWTLGPIPMQGEGEGWGKEVVIRTTTNLTTGRVLFTDSNGREMIRREFNSRPSWPLEVSEAVAGNYYPITSGLGIQDPGAGLGLTLATDRAQGAASLEEGQVEVMLHRTTLIDDARGVGEPLAETLCGCLDCNCPGLMVRGTHLLRPGPLAGAAAARRTLQQKLNDPVLLAFAKMVSPTGRGGSHAAAAAGGLDREPAAAGTAARSAAVTQHGSRSSNDGSSTSRRYRSSSSSSTGGQSRSNISRGTRDSNGSHAGGDATAAAAATIAADQLSGYTGAVHPIIPHQEAPQALPALGPEIASRWSGVKDPHGLPPNVHLLTLMRLGEEGHGRKVLLRLAHSFQACEDPALSAPVTVDLKHLLHLPVVEVEELNLSGAQYSRRYLNSSSSSKHLNSSSSRYLNHSTTSTSSSSSTQSTIEPAAGGSGCSSDGYGWGDARGLRDGKQLPSRGAAATASGGDSMATTTTAAGNGGGGDSGKGDGGGGEGSSRRARGLKRAPFVSSTVVRGGSWCNAGAGVGHHGRDFRVELLPMEVRTFELTLAEH